MALASLQVHQNEIYKLGKENPFYLGTFPFIWIFPYSLLILLSFTPRQTDMQAGSQSYRQIVAIISARVIETLHWRKTDQSGHALAWLRTQDGIVCRYCVSRACFVSIVLGVISPYVLINVVRKQFCYRRNILPQTGMGSVVYQQRYLFLECSLYAFFAQHE